MAPLSGGMADTHVHSGEIGGASPVRVQNGDGLTAVEFESASARTDAHPRTTLQVRASQVLRLKLQAGRASRDRQDATGRDTTPRPPSTHLRSVSMNRSATTQRRSQLPIAERPGWAPAEPPSRVRQLHVERVESLLRFAGLRAQFLANHPEM
jgi:hypothetical protein